MFFVNHRNNECSDVDGTSYMNLHEASFTVALSKYFIQQGYATTKVTILTTYKTQLKKIKQLLNAEPLLEGIHATTVDNFQGEENDIILVSFVRSNADQIIGFLRTSNRVNVALSRAKKGLYCVGNFEYMAEKCKRGRDQRDHFPWDKLVEKLKKQEAFGNALEIRCQIHGTVNMVESKHDFEKKAPRGGCSYNCKADLGCGHLCSRVCHILNKDAEHKQMRRNCTEPCKKNLRCGHKCIKVCHEDCGSVCTKIIEKKSRCGHTVNIECSDSVYDWKLINACTEPCNVELRCGHRCKGSCSKCHLGRLHIR